MPQLPLHVLASSPEVQSFYRAFQRVENDHVAGLLRSISHRWVLSNLCDAFDAASLTLSDQALDPERAVVKRVERGVRNVSEAKRQLFLRLYPEFEHVDSLRRSQESRFLYSRFTRQISRGRRWQLLGQRFGRGIFALIPHQISHRYVERGIAMDSLFQTWLDLIGRFNDRVETLAESLVRIVEATLDGRPMPQSATDWN
jgi:hypothetical protein